MKTIEYKLEGTRNQAGAIGEPEKFTLTVSRQTGTMTVKEAMNTARRLMYDGGFEHILFTSCAVRVFDARKWQTIPMLEALGLE